MGFTGVNISGPDTLRYRIAKAIWERRPDCHGKTWPLDSEKSQRAYLHEPIASVDLSFVYADAALAVIQCQGAIGEPLIFRALIRSGESEP